MLGHIQKGALRGAFEMKGCYKAATIVLLLLLTFPVAEIASAQLLRPLATPYGYGGRVWATGTYYARGDADSGTHTFSSRERGMTRGQRWRTEEVSLS